MRKIVVFLLLLVLIKSQAQGPANKYPITPKPQQLTPKAGSFNLSASTVLLLDDAGQKQSANFLNDYLKRFCGFTLKVVTKATKNYIRLGVKRLLVKGIDGKYDLQITPASINISGDTYQGTFYGVQTIIQLLPIEAAVKLQLPCVEIRDQPRFAYRGLHLDVARHFMPIDFVKKYIDYIAYFKLNTFHWHLTDDQGWRIEIKKYPKLTTVGGFRDGTIIGRYPGTGNDNKYYGGFYTQKQIKEIVQYAKDRFVTVIPEIEMPGHASAAIAAYPQLSCFPEESTVIPGPASEASKMKKGKKVQETWGVFEDVFAPTDYTFQFLQDVVDEVIPLFPAAYIHIGGDECPKESWKRSAFCQQLIKEKGLKDEHGLQSYFIQKMEQYINAKGKKIIGWDEILEGGLAPNAAVMSWRGEEGGITAAKQGHEVIMTPGSHCYLDHSQSKNEDSVTIGGYLPIETVYSYDPVPAALSVGETKYILGAQGNLWSEYLESPAKVEYMLFPRLAALSEVLWTYKNNKSWEDFEKRIPVVFERLDRQKVKYSKAYYDLKESVIQSENYGGVYWKLESKSKTDKIEYWNVMQASFSLDYKAAISITANGEYEGILKNRYGKRISNLISKRFFFNKATGKKISLTSEASKSYPGDGAFTLVNSVQNEKGFSRSEEFLGFNGKDCEAIIDLGKMDTINKVMVHSLEQQGSWIYLPKSIEVFTSYDEISFTPQPIFEVTESKPGNNIFTISLPAINARFVKVKINNYGQIPEGNPGAGSPAWLFVDEIEVW
jgi:hexosaminidase